MILFSSIRQRLIAFAAAAIVAVLAVAGGAGALLRWTHESDARASAEVTDVLRGSHQALERLVAAQAALQTMLRLKDADEIEQGAARYEKITGEAAKRLPPGSVQIQTKFKALQESGHQVLQEVLTANNSGAIEAYVSRYNPVFDECIQALRQYTDAVERAAAAEAAERAATVQHVLRIAAGSLGVIVIALIFGAWRFQRAVSSSLSQTAKRLAEVADALAHYSDEVTRSSHAVAHGATDQAASLEETSASLEEMSSMTKRNAESAGRAKGAAGRMRQAADVGATDMEALSVAMAAIKDSSSNIGKIVKTIDEIAFQTNILALNAAVEAARAGEAGAGFAVVADEVRSLAQRSAQAAHETAEKIAESIARGENGATLSGKVATGLHEIVSNARSVDELIGEIATASNEQNQGLQQIVTAVSQIDGVTQSNAASAEESAAVVASMKQQVEILRESVVGLSTLLGETAQFAPRADGPAVN